MDRKNFSLGYHTHAIDSAFKRIHVARKSTEDEDLTEYATTADAIADLYMAAFDDSIAAYEALKRSVENPLPSKAVYETIVSLTEVALDGVEVRKRDADGIADALAVEEAQYAVSRGQVIVDHYADAYRGGDLK